MANLLYFKGETALVWSDTTTPAFGLNNLASGAGQQGAEKDLGILSTAKSRRYTWRAVVEFATPAPVGQVVRIYLKTGDGTDYDNDDGETDLTVSDEDKLRNCMRIGTVVVDQNATGIQMSAGGEVEISERYVMPIFWNETDDNLVATNDLSSFTLTPVPDELQ